MRVPAYLTMDFFEHQERARRHSFWLLVGFAAAILLKGSLYGLIVSGLANLGSVCTVIEMGRLTVWRPAVFGWTFLVLAVATLLGFYHRTRSLSGGGVTLARQLGGRSVLPGADDPYERRLLNIVQEMAVATGVPVPAVFLLEGDRSINAFAAGYTASDAAIGVTRGCMERLTRDELQAVLAHEFSHIVNGDMSLNLRLISVLYGIGVIGLIGKGVMYVTMEDPQRDGWRAGRRPGDVMGNDFVRLLFFLGGTFLVLLDGIGLMICQLIRCTLSRQREFLADAAAVQFTRNPGGMTGALRKIGGLGPGFGADWVGEASHLLFNHSLGRAEDALVAVVERAFSTHPPLGERIRRVDPQFDGSYPAGERILLQVELEPEMPGLVAGFQGADSGRMAPDRVGLPAGDVAGGAGTLSPGGLDRAVELLRAVPPAARRATQDAFGARAVVFALLLDRSEPIRKVQWRFLEKTADDAVLAATRKLETAVAAMPLEARLPLLDLAVPALKLMSDEQRDRFFSGIKSLAEADDHISLFEYALQKVLRRRLAPAGSGATPVHHSIEAVRSHALRLLAVLAYYGNGDDGGARAAFAFAARRAGLDEKGPLDPGPRPEDALRVADEALEPLARSASGVKRTILEACAYAVAADGVVTRSEGEMIRAISAALDCPIPPFLGIPEAAPEG